MLVRESCVTGIFFFFLCYLYRYVELCVAKQLTPQTLDLEVQGSSLARRVV